MSVAVATGASNAIQTPDGWRFVRLGEVSAIRRKQVKPREGDARPFVGLENMNSGGALNGHSTAGESISNKTIFFEGDTLYGKLRPNLRKVVRADFDGVCSTDILAIHANERLTGSFLNHLVRSDLLYKHAMRGVTGTRMPRTSWKHLQSFRFLLPPLSEQRAIAAVLDSIDEAIERTDEAIAATERLRDSLLHELLTRGLPGHHSEWKEVPGLGTIPASWDAVQLGDVMDINRDSWLPKNAEEIIYYLDLTAVAAPGLVAEPREIVSAEAPSRARRRVHSGDILVSTVRPNLRGFARINRAINNLIASTGFAVLSPRLSTISSYVYHHVMTPCFAAYLENATTGQAYPAVRPVDVAAYAFGLPPLREQRAIAAVLDGVDDSIERARAERTALAAVAISVADALLTGRVRVDQRRK